MVQKLLNKIYNYYQLQPTRSKFFELIIKSPVTSILEIILWGPIDIKKFIKTLMKFKYLVLLGLILLISLTITYNLGSSSREFEIRNLEQVIENKDKLNEVKQRQIKRSHNKIMSLDYQVDSLKSYLRSREYLEFKIYQKAHLRNFKINMNRVSDEVLFLMAQQADKYNIPYTIYFRLIEKESGFKFIPNHGGSGAFGYMQLMPYTFRSYAKKLGLKGGHTEKNNVLVGSYYLNKNYHYWKDKGMSDRKAWEFCLAEYNAGQPKMRVYSSEDSSKVIGHRIPSYTRGYINYILKFYPKNQ